MKKQQQSSAAAAVGSVSATAAQVLLRGFVTHCQDWEQPREQWDVQRKLRSCETEGAWMSV